MQSQLREKGDGSSSSAYAELLALAAASDATQDLCIAAVQVASLTLVVSLLLSSLSTVLDAAE